MNCLCKDDLRQISGVWLRQIFRCIWGKVRNSRWLYTQNHCILFRCVYNYYISSRNQPEKIMNEFTVIETFNNVRVLKREDGKFGVEDMHENNIAWRFRLLDSAMENARAMSAENDRVDAYESNMK